jgi:hypothetical protein
MRPPLAVGGIMVGDTLDRHRYLTKITQASNKQLQLFRMAQEARQLEGQAPKERLIQKYMTGGPQPGSLFDPKLTMDRATPLGKHVS